MKILISLVLLLLVSGVWGAQNQDTPAGFLLQEHQAGKLKIGMTVDDLYTAYREYPTRLVDRSREGFFTPAIEVYLQKDSNMNPSLAAEFRGDDYNIYQIEVLDKRFKTAKGIGVNSTLGDLRKAYTVNRIDWGEAGFFAEVQEIGMGFILNTAPPPGWPDKKDSRLFPDNAKISSIFLN